eukprot:TRINITY_DN5430_c0_g2_i2.p1 TRINITY_DN5430_c0_g2~~TRINITY_DN5430_c0_g2_i2.p1  ORF type:complete len:216 (+),score=45.51 TRINITY_DN5430_c0_g2_i2:253-900(+)
MMQVEKNGWLLFFLSYFFVSIGSAYYHWRPNNWSLVWDRLPMTLCFMTQYYLAQKNFIPADDLSLTGNIALGTLSIILWYFSLYWNKDFVGKLHVNYLGNNDGTNLTRKQAQEQIAQAKPKLKDQLLPYFIIQFFPLIAITVMLFKWPADAELKLSYVAPGLSLYALAKVLEGLDLHSDHFYKTLLKGRISGHSLKHLAAGFAACSFMLYIYNAK